MSGLLVVDRKRPFSLPNEAGCYRGFDGTLWPDLQPGHPYLEAGLAPVSAVEVVKGLVDEQHPSRELLFVTSEEGFACPLRGELAGYDVGVLESGYNYFSILLNEVLVGPLAAWRHLLNENGLLRDPLHAPELLRARDELVMSGGDLEDLDRAPRVFAIYANIGA